MNLPMIHTTTIRLADLHDTSEVARIEAFVAEMEATALPYWTTRSMNLVWWVLHSEPIS